MTNHEAARRIRSWANDPECLQDTFSWPTDSCSYEQHNKFVNYKNTQFAQYCSRTKTEGLPALRTFTLDYADYIERLEEMNP